MANIWCGKETDEKLRGEVMMVEKYEVVLINVELCEDMSEYKQ